MVLVREPYIVRGRGRFSGWLRVSSRVRWSLEAWGMVRSMARVRVRLVEGVIMASGMGRDRAGSEYTKVVPGRSWAAAWTGAGGAFGLGG